MFTGGNVNLSIGYNNASSTFSGGLTTPPSLSTWNAAGWMVVNKIGSGNLTINSNTSTAGPP